MNIIVSIFVVFCAVLIAAQASASPAPSVLVRGAFPVSEPITGPLPAASVPPNCTLDSWSGTITCEEIAAPRLMH